MTFVDHLKGQKGEEKFLEVAFGLHVIEGDLTKSIVTGASPTHVVTVQHLLGDAFGKGWKAVKGAWFRGINRDSTKYKFHPGIKAPNPVDKTFTANSTTDTITSTAHGYANGTMVLFIGSDLPAGLVRDQIYYVINTAADTFQVSLTSGGGAIDLTSNGSGTLTVRANDATQGIDPVFDKDTPHSNTAWIRLECPNGAETGIPDFDTKASPPDGFSGIFECQLGDIYDNTGTVTSSDQLITNPADVIAFGCIEIRRYPTSRIDWPSLVALRGVCDATVTPDYRTLLPQGVGLTARYYDGSAFNTLKSRRVDPVIQYDLSAGAPALDITATGFSARFEGWIRFKYSETYTIYLTHNDTGKCWVDNLTTPIINGASTATTSGTFAATADAFYALQLEWTNAAGDSQFTLEWQSASQPRQVVPQDRLYPKNEAMKRFEAHAKFLQRTNFDQFLRSILFLCNGGFQDVNGKLTFFCFDEVTASFNFDETNIVKNSLKFRPRFTQQEIFNLPNRFIAEGRDLESRYLQPFDPQLFYDLPDLQSAAGRINEEIVNIGSATRSQSLANLAHHAKLQTAPLLVEFEGMPQTLSVLQGDKVAVTHSLTGWSGRTCLVVEATDKSIDAAADNRIFRLLDWE